MLFAYLNFRWRCYFPVGIFKQVDHWKVDEKGIHHDLIMLAFSQLQGINYTIENVNFYMKIIIFGHQAAKLQS